MAMTNEDYQIPDYGYVELDSIDDVTRQEIESVFETVELNEEVEQVFEQFETTSETGSYTHIKLIEQDTEVMRGRAHKDNLPKLSAVDKARQALRNIVFLTESKPKTLYAQFVEAESHIGGRPIKLEEGVVSHRFWFYQGDWYYELHDALGPVVARYHFEHDSVVKIDGATDYPLYKDETIDEEANILEMIRLYHENIQELYPDDRAA